MERRRQAAGPFLQISALIEEALAEVVERLNGPDQRWDLRRFLFALMSSTVKSTPFPGQLGGQTPGQGEGHLGEVGDGD